MKLNTKGYEKANALIGAGKVDRTGAWSFSSADSSALLGNDNWVQYADWFLGTDPTASKQSKDHYHYPFGKDGKVYASALRAIRSRAAQQNAGDIFAAAGKLLDRIEPKSVVRAGVFTKTLDCPFEIKDLSDTGTFTGYASVFGNVDFGGDVVERGAFKEIATTKDGQVRVLYQHDMRQPIGKARIEQDNKGLRVDAALVLGMPQARNAYEAMKAGILDGMSIGYDVLTGGSEDGPDGVRHLKALKLWEVSLVTFGMNPLAQVDSVKMALLDAAASVATRREFEELLRELGFTANQAKSIASRGWREAPAEQLRDAGDSSVAGVAERIKALGTEGSRDATVAGLLDTIASLKL